MRSKIGSSMRQLTVLAIATISVTACATGPSSLVVCPPVVPYDQAFLDRAVAELDLLPDSSALETMISDYAVMRDQARACQ